MDHANIRSAIENTTRALTEHPEKARAKSAPLTARWVDGLRFEVTGGGGERVPMGSLCVSNPGALGMVRSGAMDYLA